MIDVQLCNFDLVYIFCMHMAILESVPLNILCFPNHMAESQSKILKGHQLSVRKTDKLYTDQLVAMALSRDGGVLSKPDGTTTARPGWPRWPGVAGTITRCNASRIVCDCNKRRY